ncbi:MAG: TIR domain-containing protein [Gammaproteobacteria bacterium]|nr:TIR domain-containing protein [Gammaproteobacteria bacterium]
MHRVFISYHHDNDQPYKEKLVEIAERNSIFVDMSVDTGDITEDLDDEHIRKIIRDNYLRDSTVTIVLVGTDTKHRKHVDWEIHSSMYDGVVNKRSGILVINLPTIPDSSCQAAYGEEEKKLIHPEITTWTSVDAREEYERLYPHMPDRIIDNLIKPKVTISVVPWYKINASTLRFLIDMTFQNRSNCKYDLSRKMKRANR